jgi:hypothetical protein
MRSHGGVLLPFNLWQDWRELHFSEAIFRLRAWDLIIRNPNAIWYNGHHYNLGFIVQLKTQKTMILRACLLKNGLLELA